MAVQFSDVTDSRLSPVNNTVGISILMPTYFTLRLTLSKAG